jgi:hypothetical protein
MNSAILKINNLVISEAIKLKNNATKEELDQLNFKTLNTNSLFAWRNKRISF